ncbi:uncharacterized protein LOC106646659 [Copidosoma floridanum]|uniref:uncharacterized protein LOC106646659 n=1 Tax=Copidosoma floridanum TaxID=29053 RepID=UPI0006C9804A|nr:uncharacterized protein LOC106646659 [Copidosoma floridanum]
MINKTFLVTIILLTLLSLNRINPSQALELSSVSRQKYPDLCERLHMVAESSTMRVKEKYEEEESAKDTGITDKNTTLTISNKEVVDPGSQYMYGSSVWDVTLWHDTAANCCNLIGCPLPENFQFFQLDSNNRISCHCIDGSCHGGDEENYWVLNPNF